MTRAGLAGPTDPGRAPLPSRISRRIRWVLALILSVSGAAAHAGNDPLFDDGFEGQCLVGPAPSDQVSGALGVAPTSGYSVLACIEIRSDLADPITDYGETGSGAIAIPRDAALTDANLAELRVVGANGQMLSHQLRVLSRWGGPLDPEAGETAGPIRWLSIAVPSRLGSASHARYELRRYQSPPSTFDIEALVVNPLGGNRWRIYTRFLESTVDLDLPAILEGARILHPLNQPSAALFAGPGDGPRLRLEAVDGLGIAPQELSGVIDRSEWVEQGPVQATLLVEGHFPAADGSSLCEETAPPYERLRWSATWRWRRNSPDIEISFHVGNTCSDGVGLSWTDNTVAVSWADWRLSTPFDGIPTLVATHTDAAGARIGESTALLAQDRGGGNPWQRMARNRVGANSLSSNVIERPLLGAATSRGLVVATHAWQRHREPQALRFAEEKLHLEVVSASSIIGEGKMLWNRSLLRVVQPPASTTLLLSELPLHAQSLALDAERPRLVRDLLGPGGTGISPPTAHPENAAGATLYRAFMENQHQMTTDPTSAGQWARQKAYGSQVWPDVPFDDRFGVSNDSPADFDGRHNYWNPSGAELEEFFRTGDPRWAWDFALPATWLQVHTAYLNQGDQMHGRSNGTAVTSGGAGDGQWHRSNFGSDDYTYHRGLALAYVLWPEPTLRLRLRDAGLQMSQRYSVPRAQQAQRDQGLEAITPERQQIQHFESIALCAEFVPGAAGRQCHARLLEILEELEAENMVAGLICQGDLINPTECVLPQQFMANALIYPFFDRMARMYAGNGQLQGMAQMLRSYPREVMRLNQGYDGTQFRPDRDWFSALVCTLDGGGVVVQCTPEDTGDGIAILAPNRPHTLWLPLNAARLDGDPAYCGSARQAFDTLMQAGPGDFGLLDEYAGGGWWKGSAQVVQGLLHAVALGTGCP